MGRSPCCEKNGLKKGPWTAEGDAEGDEWSEESFRPLPRLFNWKSWWSSVITGNPRRPLHRIPPASSVIIGRSVSGETPLPRSLHRMPPSSSEVALNIQMTGAVAGDEADPEEPPEETTGTNSPVGGGEGADHDLSLPRPVHRFMLYRIYASIPVMLGTNIHILASMMEPTTENKILIGVSMISLGGNVFASIWLIFRGGDMPNVDWKNISFKITFVFTGILTFYASFSTLAPNWFTLPGIVLCGALAIGLGHSEGLIRLYKKFIATIKIATQKIRELIA